MLHYDATSARMREISLKRDPSCSFCVKEPKITTPGSPTSLPSDFRQLKEIGVDAAQALIQKGFDGILLDVREPQEHAWAHLKGSTLAPLSELAEHLDSLPRDLPYLVYCKVGQRSAHAGRMMLEAGFEDITNLSGGIMDWIRRGGPIVQK